MQESYTNRSLLQETRNTYDTGKGIGTQLTSLTTVGKRIDRLRTNWRCIPAGKKNYSKKKNG